MERKPLYRSIRESYARDIYMPCCGAAAAPVVVAEVVRGTQMAWFTGEQPPQNVILHLDAGLNVVGSAGEVLCGLREALVRCARSVPVLYLRDEATAEALAEFVERNNLADAILCAPFERRAVLKSACARMSLLRGMLDMRGVCVATAEIPALAVSHEATSVILAGEMLTAENIDSLQRRFIHVVAAGADFALMATRGANGVVTEDVDAAYDFLARFPEGSCLRRKKLYAHKGFSNGGQYSENTITSVVAAAENHFDGAEIDVKLTADDVPVVMHNTDTRGLFDCARMVTEETDFATLASLRRIGFPDESIDRFEDLMRAMRPYEETPVLIEFKPSAKYCNVEEMVRLAEPILLAPQSQRNCICIMGDLLPGHAYVHRHLPFLPISYCEGVDAMPPAPQSRAEAEDCIYRIARLTQGCAAGYNAEDVGMNRLLNEYAKFRMITVFPWSRSWTLEPSKWEEHGPDNCDTYLAGYDAWTTDHGEKFLDLPVVLEPVLPDGKRFIPVCRAVYRDGRREEVRCGVMVLSGEVEVSADGCCTVRGSARVMYSLEIGLYFGKSYTIYSEPVEL